jgi:biotin carboxyl carrier protein
MKRYRVNVNGVAYEIELEELTGAAPAAAPVAAPAPAAAPVAAPAPAAAPAAGEQVTAPIPGTILSINVNVGDSVQEGQVLMILEAMKMENEIMCPKTGKVASINTSKGSAVDSGTLLCVIQ